MIYSVEVNGIVYGYSVRTAEEFAYIESLCTILPKFELLLPQEEEKR